MILFPFFFFLLISWALIKRNKRIEAGAFITLVYTVSTFFSIIVFFQSPSRYDVWILPTIVFCGLILMSVIPIIDFKTSKISSVQLKNEKVFTFYCYVAILSFVIVVVCRGADVIGILQGDMGAIRRMFYAGMLENDGGSNPIYLRLAHLVSYFSSITLLCFFYSMCFLKKGILFNILLFISSFIQVFIGISNASRTPVIYWLLVFFLLFFIFRPFFPQKAKRLFFVFFIIATIPVAYLMLVTVARFSDSGATDSLIYYLGSPFVSFVDVFNHYNGNTPIVFNRIFPILSGLFDNSSFDLYDYRESMSNALGAQINAFVTFLGDALTDVGFLGMFCYVTIFFIIAKLVLKRNSSSITLGKMVLFVVIARLPLQGIFAFVYLRPMDTVYFGGCIILASLFDFSLSLRKRIVPSSQTVI